MPSSLPEILELLTLRSDGACDFIGDQPADGLDRLRVYGGQVAAQAVMAAAHTVTGRALHSLHVSFLRPGDPAAPLRYEVVELREGRTFSTRRVTAHQGAKVVMEALTSFAEDVDGTDYQQPMPDVPAPDTLPLLQKQLAPYTDQDYTSLNRFRIVEMRYIDPPPRVAMDRDPQPHAACRLWLRFADAIPTAVQTDQILNAALLAYVSDWTILDPVQVAVGKTWKHLATMASLDHAMWFHRRADFTDWLLYDQHSVSAARGRGLGSGAIYNRDGSLVCSVTQEGFLGRPL